MLSKLSGHCCARMLRKQRCSNGGLKWVGVMTVKKGLMKKHAFYMGHDEIATPAQALAMDEAILAKP